MKKSEIVIGERYLTRVSGALVEVIATGWHKADGAIHKRDRVCVKRADGRLQQLKPRDPSALHEREREESNPYVADGPLPMGYMQGRGAS